MDLGLKRKLIVVGGGAGGVGQAVCNVLRDEGAEVVVADKTTGVDLADYGDVIGFFSDLHRSHEYLYGYCSLVYGGTGDDNPFSGAIPENIESTLRNTLLAAVYPVKRAAEWMKERGGGSIVIVSSVNSILGLNEFPYDLAKGALNRIAPDIATDCGKYGVRAVTLCPGTICGTLSWEGREKDLGRIASAIPDGQVTTALEVANAIAFLLSPHGAMFNGSTIVADRGWSLRPVFKQ